MKSFILTTFILFISYSGYSQAQAQAQSTKVQVQSTTINQREYADRLPEVLDEIKPNSMNLDEVEGFVLVKVSHTSGKRGVKNMIKTFKDAFANT